MAAATGAIVYKNAVFTIEETSYANQVRRARLIPDTPEQSYRTLVPDGVVVDVDSTLWTLELEGLQIWTAGGLADFLNDNAGTAVDCLLQLASGTGKPTASFSIIAKPMPFGGEQGEFLNSDTMTFTVSGGVTFGTSS